MQVWELTNYFGQFLSPQWNTRELRADSAESSAQDPLGLFAVGREGIEKGMTRLETQINCKEEEKKSNLRSPERHDFLSGRLRFLITQ